MGDSSELKRLVEEAYRFGYFVGYGGHSEWAGWIRRKKVQMYSLAEELGVLELVRDAYRRGKAEGAKKKEEDIRKGLGKGAPILDGRGAPEVFPFEETSEEIEGEFIRFIETTRLYLPPDLLDTLKNIRPPKMLRLGF
ncbi:hypothetical protein [Thermococcus sp.]|uniref:hypothetical protein n=1 Tax=Thermococcus sp. TaxID=35749 RepID=UPI002620AFF8|nr:hypothetical protein [Thermococcus sp.]